MLWEAGLAVCSQAPLLRQPFSQIVQQPAVAQPQAADVIAIGTRLHNYNIPPVLKADIDHIVRKGLTLGFSGEGLVHGKTCAILMASGGVYAEGSPLRDCDIATA